MTNKYCLSILTLVTLFCIGEAKALAVKRCDPTASQEMIRAQEFIQDYMDPIFAEWETRIDSFPERLQRKVRNKFSKMKQRYRKKTANVVLICQDDKKGCINNRYLGVAKWKKRVFSDDRGNKIRVCYYDHVSIGSSFCNLVDTVAHEIAHKAAIPKQKGHSKRPFTVFNTDPVYQFGDAAKTICQNADLLGALVNDALEGMSNRPIGTSCSLNDQCGTGKCEGKVPDKLCVCRNDSDCAVGERCKTKGVNQCVAR